MIAKIGKKIAAGCLMMFVLVALCLALLRAVPGGPFDSERAVSPEIEAALAERYGTNQSYAAHLVSYLSNAARLDLGPSFQYSDYNVSELIAQALPITLLVGGLALAIAWLVALPLALLGAAYPDSWIDGVLRFLSISLLSTPKFVTAPLLALLFASTLGWLPSAGLGEPLWKYLLLPAFALALTQLGVAVRVLRGALKDVQTSDALKAARARGLSPARMRWRHLLPIALPSALAFLLPSAIAVLTGSAVVEQVYSLPGLGRALVGSALNRDYTLLLGVVITSGALVIVLGWLVEAALMWLDPRRR